MRLIHGVYVTSSRPERRKGSASWTPPSWGVGDPRQVARGGAGDLDVQPDGPVLALGQTRGGPSRTSTEEGRRR